MNQLKSNVGSKPLVQIKVEYQSNLPSLVTLWASKIRDQRRISQDDIETVFIKLKFELEGDMPMPEAAIGFMRSAETLSRLIKWLSLRKADAFIEFFDEKTLREFETI
ncbi:MAG: hypothetical protein EPN47_15665 [Acidobacteria bacterium]|nr:MAG: hypothetical protein EPN47_15665 [Acidobacteriota bacterium]